MNRLRNLQMLFVVLCMTAYSVIAAPQLTPQLTPQNLEMFFDTTFEAQSRDHKLVGLTVAVVKDGEVVLKKGYGFADLENRIAVDPDKHLFRIASVSKPFTWLAVMQLVEQGKLDLDADIQQYLDFDIPKTYEEPIRLRHLLTHTPGFEERATGGFARSSGEVLALSEYLPKHLPSSVRAPGTFISYSDYGSALAGYIIERVSGVAWANYIDENIIKPLDMTNTNVFQPMSARHLSQHAKGYRYFDGRFESTDFWFEHEAPAGIMSMTAEDMTHWMLMHLNQGRYNGVSLLKPETLAQMHSQLFLQHPSGKPVLHGFYRSDQNGTAIFGHGGDVNQFHSDLSFVPEHNLGIFVSYNSDPSARARSNVVPAFMNTFFPAPYPKVIEANKNVSIEDYVGSWTSTRRNHSSFEKLTLLVSQMNIRSDDGELVLTSQQGTTRWIPVAQDKFRARYGNEHLLFYRDSQNKVSHFSGEGGLGSFEKLSWYEARNLHLMGYLIVVILSSVYVLRFIYHLLFARKYADEMPVLDQCLGALASMTMIFLIYRLAMALVGDRNDFLYGIPESIAVVFRFTLVFSLLALVILWRAGQQWVLNKGTLLGRANYTLLALAICFFLYLNW
ncbi:MAG: CubicO group peptidase (beta-lactamase class C family), partial [Flavobacterium sp.]